MNNMESGANLILFKCYYKYRNTTAIIDSQISYIRYFVETEKEL